MPEHDRGDVVFRQGDKVMQVKNNYKQEWKILDPSGRFAKEEGVGVFNGDIGFVKAVDDYEQRIVVEFDDGRQTEYPYNQLEELEHAKARGAKIYAEVVGYGCSSDAYHITSPQEDGAGEARAMTNAMSDAGVTPADVKYINAHGTGTHHNDLFELQVFLYSL